MRQIRSGCESREVAVAFDCARGLQDGEQLEWGVLGESVHHRVGVCARRAASPLWAAPRPGVGSVADASIEAFLDANLRLEEMCAK